MNSFTNFYLTEDLQSIKLNWYSDVLKGTEIDKGMYIYSKNYFNNPIFKKNGFKINDKIFKIVSAVNGDPKTSQIYDKGLLGHSWNTIKEIIKYNLNFGEVYLITVSNGSNDYYFIGNDKKFFQNSNSSIYRVVEFLRPKQQKLAQKQTSKVQSKEADIRNQELEASKKAEQEKQSAEQNKILSKKIASDLKLTELGLFKFKDEMLDLSFEAKSVEEAQKKIKEATQKLPDTDPRHGRFGFFDISFEDFDMLTGPKGKFMSNRNWKTRSELAWHTDTRTSEDQEFGIGLYYPIKSDPKAETKGISGKVYLFKYYDKFLPHTAIMIFDGINSLRIFDELRILSETDKIGLDKKIRLKYSKNLRWVDERPQDIAPPDTAKTISKKAEIGSETQISTKTRYVTPQK
jgi:hypothetical protein